MNPKALITRRNALITGLASVGGLLLPGCSQPMPPTYGHLLRMGDNLTYAAHRALLPGQSLAREYRPGDISSFPATGTTNPGDPDNPNSSEEYRRLHRESFAGWRLVVEGLVSRPGAYSLADL
ncbi:MAG: hypothetical protein KIT22_04510, partial [Verrucomicrobiae bacterium]|nr:hypothetical protein [Verrucomicrobiae bacterium]